MLVYIIILMIVICIILITKSLQFSINTKEGFTKNALCLLTVIPNEIFLNFLENMTNYEIYVFVDNNSISINEFEMNHPNIYFMRFDDEKMIKEGYWDSSYIIKKKTISWDKALYYFSKMNTSYNYVWFIEDDVYVPNQESLINLDKKYSTDLLCSKHSTNYDGTNGWHWSQAEPYFELPWAGGLQCICRLSNRLLFRIKEFVDKHKKLTFIEVLFTTLVIQNNYSYICPNEFINIDCCKIHNISEIDPTYIHHPIKNIEDHKTLRQKL